MTRQVIRLSSLPRLQVIQTSAEGYGQIYLPAVNWLLMVVTLGLAISFGSSSSLAAAYGIAVSATMLATTDVFDDWRPARASTRSDPSNLRAIRRFRMLSRRQTRVFQPQCSILLSCPKPSNRWPRISPNAVCRSSSTRETSVDELLAKWPKSAVIQKPADAKTFVAALASLLGR